MRLAKKSLFMLTLFCVGWFAKPNYLLGSQSDPGFPTLEFQSMAVYPNTKTATLDIRISKRYFPVEKLNFHYTVIASDYVTDCSQGDVDVTPEEKNPIRWANSDRSFRVRFEFRRPRGEYMVRLELTGYPKDKAIWDGFTPAARRSDGFLLDKKEVCFLKEENSIFQGGEIVGCLTAKVKVSLGFSISNVLSPLQNEKMSEEIQRMMNERDEIAKTRKKKGLK